MWDGWAKEEGMRSAIGRDLREHGDGLCRAWLSRAEMTGASAADATGGPEEGGDAHKAGWTTCPGVRPSMRREVAQSGRRSSPGWEGKGEERRVMGEGNETNEVLAPSLELRDL